MTIDIKRGGHKKTSMRYNRCGDDFLIDKIKPDEVGADLVIMVDLLQDKEWQIYDDDEYFWQEDYSIAERQMGLEQSEAEKREQKNVRILEWIYDLPSGENDGQSKQQAKQYPENCYAKVAADALCKVSRVSASPWIVRGVRQLILMVQAG